MEIFMRPGWLYGWKDIADYVGCDVSTVKRYATNCKLPIRRLPTGKPVAIPFQIDKWLNELKNP